MLRLPGVRSQPETSGRPAAACFDIEQPHSGVYRQRFEKLVVAFRVVLSHAADVMTEMTFGDELRQDGLFERRRMTVNEAAGRSERLDEALGEDHEPKAQPVEEYFREGADRRQRDLKSSSDCSAATGQPRIRYAAIVVGPHDPCVRC